MRERPARSEHQSGHRAVLHESVGETPVEFRSGKLQLQKRLSGLFILLKLLIELIEEFQYPGTLPKTDRELTYRQPVERDVFNGGGAHEGKQVAHSLYFGEALPRSCRRLDGTHMLLLMPLK